MCMKWIGGPNHNLIVWLVPRCDTQPGPDSGHTGWGGILMTIHCILSMPNTFYMYEVDLTCV